jgi:hypothetical protein
MLCRLPACALFCFGFYLGSTTELMERSGLKKKSQKTADDGMMDDAILVVRSL